MADLINAVRKAPHGIGVLYWAPERGAWNDDGSPAPTVFVLDSLVLAHKAPPESRSIFSESIGHCHSIISWEKT